MKETQTTLTFNEIKINDYEKVIEVKDKVSGLHAIIAIHNTKLGPALGGIRAYPYATFGEALTDVLRLSRGMTYKSAVAETGTGGGKSVILLDPKVGLTEKMLLSFAEAVNVLQGEYICAEDVGVSVEALGVIGKVTRHAVGLPHPKSSDDPSRFTARGGYRGIQAVCKKLWGTPSPKGRKIAIQGLGAVGMKLASTLFWEGAELIVTDIHADRVAEAARELGARVVSPEEIYSVECDIFAPCAMGGILNVRTVPTLRCSAIAGLANNQLQSDAEGDALAKRGILYAPDYVINSGGLLNVCVELEERGYNPVIARERVDRIYDVLLTIFKLAQEREESTDKVANGIAEYNLQKTRL